MKKFLRGVRFTNSTSIDNVKLIRHVESTVVIGAGLDIDDRHLLARVNYQIRELYHLR